MRRAPTLPRLRQQYQFLRLASQFLRHKRHSSCAVLHATPLRTLIPLFLSVILHL